MTRKTIDEGHCDSCWEAWLAHEPNPHQECPGSGTVIEYSSLYLGIDMPMCCPRCGGLVALVPDRHDTPVHYALPMIPKHDREIE